MRKSGLLVLALMLAGCSTEVSRIATDQQDSVIDSQVDEERPVTKEIEDSFLSVIGEDTNHYLNVLEHTDLIDEAEVQDGVITITYDETAVKQWIHTQMVQYAETEGVRDITMQDEQTVRIKVDSDTVTYIVSMMTTDLYVDIALYQYLEGFSPDDIQVTFHMVDPDGNDIETYVFPQDLYQAV